MVSEERLMVLTMLQEGKITSEEASKLLQALDELEIEEELHNHIETISTQDKHDDSEMKSPHENEKYTGFIHEEDKFDHSIKDEKLSSKFEKLEKKLDEKSKKLDRIGDSIEKKIETWGEGIGEKAEAWGENFGDKMGDWGESFGEKMEKVGEELAESATSITEKVLKMVDGFIGEGSFSIFPGSYETIVETIERNILGLDSPILEIHGVNGKVVLLSGEGDNIRIKAKCSVKKSIYDKSQPVYEVIEEDNKLVFKPRYNNGIGTSLEVYVPSFHYDRILLSTSNGRIETNDVKTNELILDTSNGSIKIQDVRSSRVIACTNNSAITIGALNAKEIELVTSNASINVEDANCENLVATTRNGRINIIDTQSNEMILTSSNSSIKVEDSAASAIFSKTSNASIKIIDIETSNLRKVESYTSNSSIEISIDDHKKAYNIDAQTSMGRIDVEIPSLIYDLNKQSNPGKQKILAHSAYDAEADSQINIVASTSNGSIRII